MLRTVSAVEQRPWLLLASVFAATVFFGFMVQAVGNVYLNWRADPIVSEYRTIRELVMSYFEDYFNWDGDRTLRAYSRPLSLARFDRINWMTAEDDLWPVVEWLTVAHHTPLIPGKAAARLPRVDRRSYRAGVLGAPKH